MILTFRCHASRGAASGRFDGYGVRFRNTALQASLQSVFLIVLLLYDKKKELRQKFLQKLAHKDSNLEMTESESVALPFGDGPMSYQQMTLYIHGIAVSRSFCKNFL